MPILRARPLRVQYHEPPTDNDRRWWAERNTSWDDDGPPVMEAYVAIGGRYRRLNVDHRPDLYGDPLEPEGFEWHFGI